MKHGEPAPSDEQLIREAAQGSEAAFTALVRRYEDTVYKFSLKLCRDKQKAEEALQDTFVNIYRKLDTFDGRSKFSTWLYTIVANNCLMKRRRRKLQEIEEPIDTIDHRSGEDGHGPREIARWDDTPAELMLNKELRTLLTKAIEKLPPDYRAVFVLRDIEGKSTEETAEILNISQEAAKSRLRRARAFLRERLDPYMSTHHGTQS